jgi:hypothetical protein
MGTDFQHDVFLSHNSQDKPRVRRLAAVSQPSTPNHQATRAIKRGLERSISGRGNLPLRNPANAGWRFLSRLQDIRRGPKTPIAGQPAAR